MEHIMGEDFNILAWLLMIAGVAIHRIEAISIKKYNEKHGKGGFIFTAILSFVAMLFFIAKDIIIDPTGLNFTLDLVILGLLGGICYASASYLTFVATGCGPFVLTSLFLSYTVLVSMGYGLFVLGEPATVFTYIGIVLIVLSLFFVRAEKKEGKGVKITLKWVICVALGFAGNGLCSTVQKLAPHYAKAPLNQNLYMIIALGISASVLIAASFLAKERDRGTTLRRGAPLALVCGLCNGGVNLLVLFLNGRLPASVMFPAISAGQIILVCAYSLLSCRERFTPRQWLGFGVGILSLILLNL
jgi:drug/metabolite transporter (DMT)-like permease